MSGIGSIGSYSSFFSQLDTKNKGYIDKSDLVSAFAKISEDSSSDDSVSIDQVFGQLDSDGDGKVTQDEMSSSLQKLASELESQFNQMRMGGAMGGMGGMGGTPPPPPQDDAGFSKDELQSQIDEIGNSDSKRSDLLANIVSNFEKADADGDGKVSFKEAMAYDKQSRSGATTDRTASAGASTASATDTDASGSELAVMKRIMALVQAYAAGGTETKSGRQSGSFSIAA